MTLRELFRSRLFRQFFAGRAITAIIIFVAAYALTVPHIREAVEASEERSARAVLDNVFGTVEQIHRGLENGRRNLREARKQTLRDIIALVVSRANWLEGEVSAGRMDRTRARQTLISDIRQMRYGNNDYVFGIDYRSVTIAHPDLRLNGKDMSQVRDVHGNLVVPPMVDGARKSGEGFHSYWWRRLGEDQPVEKLSYYRHLPTFDLVIGTGLYMDDIEKEMEAQRAIAIEKLRQTLRTTRIAKTGYMYVFDSKTYMHIHPNPNIEHKSLATLLDPMRGRPLAPMLMAVADKPEGLHYLWDRPDNPGNYVYEKISWVRHFQPFDWYIASSVYVDELHESARFLTGRLLGVFIVGLLLSLIASFLVERMKSRTTELEQANEELRQMDRMKSDFLSSVSHELRTPLTSILGFVSLVVREFSRSFVPLAEGDAALDKKARRIQDNLDIVQKESERLTRLINDVLDLAKIESGRTEWHDAPMQVAALVQDAVNAARGMFAQKPEVALELEIADNLPAFMADADRLQQVLVNLINNAVKFTDRGAVTMRAFLNEQSMIQIEVRDTGAGFPPEDAESIFDKFQQSKQGDVLTDKPKGTGLGLAICKEIVEHYDGRIWAASEPGKGSVFALTLPGALAVPAAPRPGGL